MEDRAKQASAMSVFLLEELGDARLRCSQLKKYLEQANSLIDASEHREHFIEVAGHLIYGIPDVLMKMEKALHAAAMAAARWDYEEIKEDLRPEKVDELETALEDIRVRRVRRQTREAGDLTARMADRSDSAFNVVLLPMLRRNTLKVLETAFADLLVDLARMKAGRHDALAEKLLVYKPEGADPSEWFEHVEEAMEAWFSTQKRSLRQAKETPMKTHEAAEQLEKIASSIEQTGQVDTQMLSQLISALEGAGNQRTASSKLEIASVLRSISASLLNTQDPKSRPSRMSLAAALRRVLGDTVDVHKTAQEQQVVEPEEGNKQASDDKESRFEEGKPADPTENMSEEDAKKWKVEHDKHEDQFKVAADKKLNKQQVKKLMGQHNIDGELSGQGEKWEVELKDEDAKAKFQKHVTKDIGGFRTGYGAWVMKPNYKSDPHDFNNPASKAHYAADEKESRFEEGKPADPTENMSEEDAKKWKVEHDKHEDQFKSASDVGVKQLIELWNKGQDGRDHAAFEKFFMTHLEEFFERGHLTSAEFKQFENSAEEFFDPDYKTASDDKESRFEEGKPADPTKDMSEEDAKEWKSNTEKYKDEFKAVSKSASDDWKV